MLTTLESGLLVALGALLTWLTGTISSQTQWRREEQRQQRERRAELYQDMFMRTRRLLRVQRTYFEDPDDEVHEPTREEIVEVDKWTARVELFASPEVDALWDDWFSIHQEVWDILMLGVKTAADRKRYADEKSRREAAFADLVDQMRKELESRS